MKFSRLLAAGAMAGLVAGCDPASENSHQPSAAEISLNNQQITVALQATLKANIKTLFGKEDLTLEDVCKITTQMEALVLHALRDTHWQAVPEAEPLIVVIPSDTAQHNFSEVLTPEYLAAKADGVREMLTQVHLFSDPTKPGFVAHTASFVFADDSVVEVQAMQGQDGYNFWHLYMEDAESGKTVGVTRAIPFNIDSGNWGSEPVVLLGAEELPNLGGECGETGTDYLQAQQTWFATTSSLATKYPLTQ